MDNEIHLNHDSEKTKPNKEETTVWDRLEKVPFAGIIGKKIDKVYINHEITRNDYDGGGTFCNKKVNEDANLDIEAKLQKEIQLERSKKIGRMVLDLPIIKQMLSHDRTMSIRARNDERIRAHISLINKKRQEEIELKKREELDNEFKEKTKKEKWIQENKKSVDDAIGIHGLTNITNYFPDNQESNEKEFSRKTNDLIEEGILSEDEQFIAAAEIARSRNETLKILEQRYARHREEIEKLFNGGLTTIDELNEAAITGEYGVTKSEDQYGDKHIEIIDSGNIDMKFLQHQIDFDRKSPKFKQEFEEHPEIWDKNIEDVSDNLSSELCLQYIDQRINPTLANGLCFGFSHVNPTSLKYFGVGNAVGGGYHKVGIRKKQSYRDVMMMRVGAQNIHSLDDIAHGTINANIKLNEFVFDRYDENGKQLKPDYIISQGKISEAMKRHAAHFNIPIVIVHNQLEKEQNIS